MDGVDRGQLTLENVPGGKGEDAIVTYLARLYESISRDKLVALIKKAPVVLSRNLPAATAGKIIAEVYRLFRVYARLVVRLAHLAELVENALSLPPLPEPPQTHN